MKQRIPESLNEFIVNESEINEEVVLNKGNETIRQHRKRMAELRLARLKEIKAPEIILKSEEDKIKNADKWTNKNIKGIEEFGDEVYASVEGKTGRGGVMFVQYVLRDGRIINFFPNAKYGQFFSEYTK